MKEIRRIQALSTPDKEAELFTAAKEGKKDRAETLMSEAVW